MRETSWRFKSSHPHQKKRALAGDLLFDAYNVPGFSGAPVLHRKGSNAQGIPIYHVIGVVSGFIPDISPIEKEIPLKSKEEASEKAKAEMWRIYFKPIRQACGIEGQERVFGFQHRHHVALLGDLASQALAHMSFETR